LAEEILSAPRDVKNYLMSEFKLLLKDPLMREAISAHLEPSVQAERFEIIIKKLGAIIQRIK